MFVFNYILYKCELYKYLHQLKHIYKFSTTIFLGGFKMSLGTQSKSNQNQKKEIHVTTYSDTAFSNVESAVDKTKLTVTFWNKTMKLAISAMKDVNNPAAGFDYDNSGLAYLSPIKAKILADVMQNFINDPNAEDGQGIITKDTYLTIHRNICNEDGLPCLVLRKFNAEGIVEATFAYEFKGYDNISGFVSADKFKTQAQPHAEINALITTLNEYYLNSNGANAHFNMEYSKFANARHDEQIRAIADKLGVSTGGGNKSTQPRSSVFDSPKQPSSSNTYSLDDLD